MWLSWTMFQHFTNKPFIVEDVTSLEKKRKISIRATSLLHHLISISFYRNSSIDISTISIRLDEIILFNIKI